MLNDHLSSGVWGVGPAERTGKSVTRYCPGGRRFSTSAGRRRPRNPREIRLAIALPPQPSLACETSFPSRSDPSIRRTLPGALHVMPFDADTGRDDGDDRHQPPRHDVICIQDPGNDQPGEDRHGHGPVITDDEVVQKTRDSDDPRPDAPVHATARSVVL